MTGRMSARKGVDRCKAVYVSQTDRCVLPAGVGGHDLARVYSGLGLPVLIHRAEDGREWTSKGPFVREQREAS